MTIARTDKILIEWGADRTTRRTVASVDCTVNRLEEPVNPSVKITTENGLARLELHREHGNAIDDTVVDGLIAACRQIEGDDRIRGVMLASQGKLFCPGLDLQQLIDKDRPEMRNFLARFQACILSMFTMEKPMVAALHGHAVAGGCVLALTADWRVLQEGAKVGLNEVKVGVPFPFGFR